MKEKREERVKEKGEDEGKVLSERGRKDDDDA